MKYPKTLSDDLKYLAEYYQWDQSDKADVRAAFTDCPEMVRYFTVLAAAHRAGYAQDAGNGFQLLRDWCLSNGLEDPYCPGFDLASLDALVVIERTA